MTCTIDRTDNSTDVQGYGVNSVGSYKEIRHCPSNLYGSENGGVLDGAFSVRILVACNSLLGKEFH